MDSSKKEDLSSIAQSAVLGKSDDSGLDKSKVVKGYDFNNGLDFDKLFDCYSNVGFQATRLGKAISITKKMIEEKDPKCKIFLGYTSNMISCGVREVIRWLCEHKYVDVICTTAGGIEEDMMKCLADTYVGKFSLKGSDLREKGINRIGNLLVPNDNYCKFEEFMNPILDQLLVEQKEKGTVWSPSKIIRRLGKEINNKDSVYYWCYKNDIPVYCPAITDGSIGDMIFFHSYRKSGLIVDLVSDIVGMNEEALMAKKTGMIILGGGVQKHHILNANLMRNGAEYSVYINTAQEYDGSDAGARPDEAVSWGKLRPGAEAVKVHGDASLLFPILVGKTFVKHHEEQSKKEKEKE